MPLIQVVLLPAGTSPSSFELGITRQKPQAGRSFCNYKSAHMLQFHSGKMQVVRTEKKTTKLLRVVQEKLMITSSIPFMQVNAFCEGPAHLSCES